MNVPPARHGRSHAGILARLAAALTLLAALGMLTAGAASAAPGARTVAARGTAAPVASVAAATPACTGTSLVHPGPDPSVTIRVPTLGNGTGNWHCLLEQGDVGVPVARLQIGLNECHSAGLAVDSDYGPKTKSAVGAVQKAFGLSVDGIAGPQTISHMEWPIKQLVSLGPPFACDPIDL